MLLNADFAMQPVLLLVQDPAQKHPPAPFPEFVAKKGCTEAALSLPHQLVSVQ